MSFVSVTRLRIRAWRYLPLFLYQALRTGRQARRARGILSVAVLSDARRTYWTCTVWVDEAAMRTYVSGGAHAKAMRSLAAWCDEASVVHWSQDTDAAPSWQGAYDQMTRQGRRSKVRHPSEAHLRFEVARPVERRA